MSNPSNDSSRTKIVFASCSAALLDTLCPTNWLPYHGSMYTETYGKLPPEFKLNTPLRQRLKAVSRSYRAAVPYIPGAMFSFAAINLVAEEVNRYSNDENKLKMRFIGLGLGSIASACCLTPFDYYSVHNRAALEIGKPNPNFFYTILRAKSLPMTSCREFITALAFFGEYHKEIAIILASKYSVFRDKDRKPNTYAKVLSQIPQICLANTSQFFARISGAQKAVKPDEKSISALQAVNNIIHEAKKNNMHPIRGFLKGGGLRASAISSSAATVPEFIEWGKQLYDNFSKPPTL